MITREDILDVAKDLKITPTEKQILFVFRYFDEQADEDPTGFWRIWVEDLLDNYDENDVEEEYYGDEINDIFEWLKKEYVDSDVTSGEFIHHTVFHKHMFKKGVNEYHIIKGIQAFLDWDDSEETFRILYDARGKYWTATYNILSYDIIEHDGIEYPVRTFEVVSEDGEIHGVYMIAPESLLEAIQDENGEIYEDCEAIDNQIYHYVPDGIFMSSAKEICAKHLDMPMEFISEITY